MHAADDAAVRLLKAKAAVLAQEERVQAAQQQHAPAWRLDALREAQRFGWQARGTVCAAGALYGARAVRCYGIGAPAVRPQPTLLTRLALHPRVIGTPSCTGW